jgi:hypothetical protein
MEVGTFTPLPRYFIGKEAPGTHSLRSWGGPQSRSLDVVEKRKIEPQFLGRPARSTLLYRLSCLDSKP